MEGDDGLVCTADGEPLPAKFQIKRGFSERDKGSSFFYDAKALEEALDWDDGALYKAPAAAPAPSPTEAVAPPTSPHDVRASRASTCDSDVNAVIAQRVEEIVRASSPVAAEAPAPAPPRKRRRRKKKALAKVAAVDALLAEANSPERKAQIEREQRRAEEEAAERAAAEKKATLQANSDSAKEIYRQKQAERRAKKAAKAAATATAPAPAPAPAPAVGSAVAPKPGRRRGRPHRRPVNHGRRCPTSSRSLNQCSASPWCRRRAPRRPSRTTPASSMELCGHERDARGHRWRGRQRLRLGRLLPDLRPETTARGALRGRGRRRYYGGRAAGGDGGARQYCCTMGRGGPRLQEHPDVEGPHELGLVCRLFEWGPLSGDRVVRRDGARLVLYVWKGAGHVSRR